MERVDSLDFASLIRRYRTRALRPSDVVRAAYQRIAQRGNDPVWIHLIPEADALARARALETRDRDVRLPLHGLPFAIKDNIDIAGYPTTAACPDFAYTPAQTAPVVQRLIDAGAILLGKTNLDQFATGLVGTRSPYGTCANAFDARYIAGGSSSGSAVAVATGLVSFALGTDTAGSGRVPAAFNNIVGLKPTRGVISSAGLVPACRSLDCVSIFALTGADAQAVLAVARGFDAADPYSRPTVEPARAFNGARFRFGVPRTDQLRFFGDTHAATAYRDALTRLEALGGIPVTIDLAPFRTAADLLYEGPWIAERLAAIRGFFASHADAIHPVVRAVIANGERYSATDLFQAQHRLEALKRDVAGQWETVDLLALPTAGTLYTVAQVEAEPFQTNIDLGYYTNFVNLLDLAAVAVPAGLRADGLPFGISLIAPAFSDEALCRLAEVFHRQSMPRLGATAFAHPPAAPPRVPHPPADVVALAVVGAHLTGQPLNSQLTALGARLLKTCHTAPHYRLYALRNTNPPKPGLARTIDGDGRAIEVEVWELTTKSFGAFVAAIPPPLGVGTIALDDGTQVKGFVCEPFALTHAEDITVYGGWRGYLARPQSLPDSN